MKVHLAFPHEDWDIEMEQAPRLGDRLFWDGPRDVDAIWRVEDVTWSISPDSPESTVILSLEPASPDAERIVADYQQRNPTK